VVEEAIKDSKKKKGKKISSEDMRPEGAVEVVARARAFVLIFRRMIFLVIASIVLSLASLGSYLAIKGHKVPPQYLPITSDGRVLPLVPLVEPSLESAEVIEFGLEALRLMHSYDYINWKTQFPRSQSYFTPSGWASYFDGFLKSNTINTVEEKKMIVSMSPKGSPKIISEGVLEGIYAWRVEIPLTITYTSHARNAVTDDVLFNSGVVTLVIQRAPITLSASGVAIRAYNLDLTREE